MRVRFEFDPRADLVLADKVQIQQVLLNLMRNAIEAMEEFERRELAVATARPPMTWSTVAVADTGAGISPEIEAQLFQPFITTKRHGHGRRPVDLAHHRRGAWRPIWAEAKSGRRNGVPASPCRW